MAETSTFIPQHHQRYTRFQQPGSDNAFVVVNQRPSRREVFPYSLHVNGILLFSIIKCIVAALLLPVGVLNVALVEYDTKIGIGIWCAVMILANGLIGCILKVKQNKCLIGAFLGLSITSLIFDLSMLSFYSTVLFYFVNVGITYCNYGYGYKYYCNLSDDVRSLGTWITSMLIPLAVCDLVCSIGSVILSGKAYCKFCNTCDVNDCCTCLGCCECSIAPLNVQQNRQPLAPRFNDQSTQRSSAPPRTYEYNPYQPQANTVVQSPAAYNAQGSQSNSCTDLMNFVVNIPAYLFSDASGTPLSSMSVNIQAVPLNQHYPVTDPDGTARQVRLTTAVGTNPTSPAWQQFSD